MQFLKLRFWASEENTGGWSEVVSPHVFLMVPPMVKKTPASTSNDFKKLLKIDMARNH